MALGLPWVMDQSFQYYPRLSTANIQAVDGHGCQFGSHEQVSKQRGALCVTERDSHQAKWSMFLSVPTMHGVEIYPHIYAYLNI